MIKRFFLSIIVVFLLSSCEYVSFKNPIKLLKNTAKDSVDFAKVDEFPVFPECDSIPSKDKQRICFQIKMSRHIYQSLKSVKLNSKVDFNDTLIVKIIVDNKGKTKLSSLEKSTNIAQNLIEIDSIIRASLDSLPILQPALKRGIPISAEFSLPIIIKTD